MANEIELYYSLDKIRVTQKFGDRPFAYAKYGLKGHNGIDYGTRFIDSPGGRRYVSAMADGVIEVVRWDRKGYGVHIRVRHPNGALSIYGHLTKPYVSKGDEVLAQQIIGLTGNTGDSTGPHLHEEYRPAGEPSSNGYAGAVDHSKLLKRIPKQFWGKK